MSIDSIKNTFLICKKNNSESLHIDIYTSQFHTVTNKKKIITIIKSIQILKIAFY